MKTELIEYHRNCALAYMDVDDAGEAEFHERAVAWLESLDESADPAAVALVRSSAFESGKQIERHET